MIISSSTSYQLQNEWVLYSLIHLRFGVLSGISRFVTALAKWLAFFIQSRLTLSDALRVWYWHGIFGDFSVKEKGNRMSHVCSFEEPQNHQQSESGGRKEIVFVSRFGESHLGIGMILDFVSISHTFLRSSNHPLIQIQNTTMLSPTPIFHQKLTFCKNDEVQFIHMVSHAALAS